jgi:23S rRNA pseudouridine2604 synthase
MATTTRKTLGLPGQARPEERVADPGRRPVRGGRSNIKRNAATEDAISTSPPVKAQPQQKPRGTPSRAPVVAKTRPLARPLSSPAITSTLGKPPQSGVRISKLMAERGLCSRREADTYIERGWVFVDGERISELGTRADPSAAIKLDKGARAAQQQQMTILLHKPIGYVSGQPEPSFTPAVTLVLPENQYCTPDTPRFHASHLKGLAPAGRLEIDSTGLLVLTQDGRVARHLIGENTSVDKEYLVRVEGRLDARGLALLNHGLSLDDRKLKPARVEWLNEDQLRFVHNEGRKRQIRRMCEQVGLRAVGLKRVRIGKVKLGDLPLGQWRFLRDDESF